MWGISSQLSSKAQLLLLTLDEGYLLTTALPDLQRGIVPLGPPEPAQPTAPWTWGWSSRLPPLASGVGLVLCNISQLIMTCLHHNSTDEKYHFYKKVVTHNNCGEYERACFRYKNALCKICYKFLAKLLSYVFLFPQLYFKIIT